MAIDEEDKVVLLVYSFSRSYHNFKDIALYSSGETLSLGYVKTSHLAKEKYDSENIYEKHAEGLMAKVEPQKRVMVVDLNSCLNSKA